MVTNSGRDINRNGLKRQAAMNGSTPLGIPKERVSTYLNKLLVSVHRIDLGVDQYKDHEYKHYQFIVIKLQLLS